MKRFLGRVLQMAPLAVGIANHRKAHDAGNDSMNVGERKIEASASGAEGGALVQPWK